MLAALASLLAFAVACLVAQPMGDAVAARTLAPALAVSLAAQALVARALALLREAAAQPSKRGGPWSERCPPGTRS